MREPVVSQFSSRYWLRGWAGAIISLSITGFYTLVDLSGSSAHPLYIFLLNIFLLGITILYFYFFTRNWKRITVTDDGIEVYYLVSRKQEVISYTSIHRIGTYRGKTVDRSGTDVFYAQNLLLEFDNGTLTINEAVYDNYSEIKAQIYNYKYGFDRVRSHY